jgi:hypothetical protein
MRTTSSSPENPKYRIPGKRYGIARICGIWFSDDPDTVRLEDFHFRINDRFLYEYDFTDNWQHRIRVEGILVPEPHRCYPMPKDHASKAGLR